VRAIRRALGQRGLRTLLMAGLVSLTGDWVLRVGLAYYVYVLTRSTVASALTLLASFVPQIVLGSLAGVFVDRWDPRRTMIAADLALALGLLPLLAVNRAGDMWLVYAVLAWEGGVQQFFAPAEQTALPSLAGDENLPTANALAGQNRDLSRLAGSAIGGVLVAAGGLAPLVLVDAGSFVVSAALLVRLPPAASASRAAATSLRDRLTGLRRQWTEGLQVSTRHRVLRTMLLFLLITCIGEGIMATLFAPFVRSILRGSGAEYGVMMSAQAIGGISGGLLAASLGNRVGTARALGTAAIAFGALDLALFLYPLAWTAVWPATVLIATAGVPGAFVIAAALTLIQRHTSDGHRGRVFGALNAVEGAAVVGGTVAAGFLARTLGIVAVLATQGAGYVVAGGFVLASLRAPAALAPRRPGRSRVGGRGTRPGQEGFGR
jgi:Na+/melibiose symporter-like transporter